MSLLLWVKNVKSVKWTEVFLEEMKQKEIQYDEVGNSLVNCIAMLCYLIWVYCHEVKNLKSIKRVKIFLTVMKQNKI